MADEEAPVSETVAFLIKLREQAIQAAADAKLASDRYLLSLSSASDELGRQIEAARTAQQEHEQKHDVQLEIPEKKSDPS